MMREARTCPYCSRIAHGDEAACTGCGKTVLPLPHLTPLPESQPSQLKDGLCCLVAGIGVFGIIGALIFFLSAQSSQNSVGCALAALCCLVFLTLTVGAWWASAKYAPSSPEWTPEDLERRLAESSELRAAFLSAEEQSSRESRETFFVAGATKSVSRVSNNGNASRHPRNAECFSKGTL